MGELETKFGELLQLERERQGTSLADLSTELKISEDNLASIEKGDAGSLPSELYYKLFSKTYAERLGIDYAKTLDAIREEIGELLEPEPKTAGARKNGEAAKPGKTARPEKATKDKKDKDEARPTEEKTFIRRVIYISSAIVIVFILVLIGYKFILSDGDDAAGSPPVGEETKQTEEAAPDEGVRAEYSGYVWGVPEHVPPESLLVTLTSREQSWATVLADGDTVLYQNLTPWREYNVKAAYRVLVSIGIPRLVEIKLDGKPIDLVDPTSGRISRAEINQANRGTFNAAQGQPRRPAVQPAATTATSDTVKRVPATETETEDSL